MRNFVKGMSAFAAVALTAGVLLLAVGWAMGGRPGVSLQWNGGHPALTQNEQHGAGRAAAASAGTQTLEPGSAFTALALDVSGAQVDIRTGDKAGLAVSGTDAYTSEVKNGTWTIASDNHTFSDTVRFTVTLPAGTQLDSAQLRIGAGALTAQGLSCGTAALSVGAGTMTLTDFACTGDATLEVGMGTLDVTGTLGGRTAVDCGMGKAALHAARPAAFGYAVDCGLGSVAVDGRRYSGVSKDVSVNAGAAVFFNIRCGMGAVTVDFT